MLIQKHQEVTQAVSQLVEISEHFKNFVATFLGLISRA